MRTSHDRIDASITQRQGHHHHRSKLGNRQGDGAALCTAWRQDRRGRARKTELDALVSEIERADGQAVCLSGDVKDESFARALVDEAVSRFGRLDVAFNNAGTMGEMGPAHQISLAGWRDTLETNLTSAFLGAKYQARAMLENG